MSEDTTTRAVLLAVVERSPDALLARDRDAWLAVFGPEAQIEDPVGSRPHRGPDEIARFYDTFTRGGPSRTAPRHRPAGRRLRGR